MFESIFTARFRAEGYHLQSRFQIDHQEYIVAHIQTLSVLKSSEMPQLNPVELHSNVDQR